MVSATTALAALALSFGLSLAAPATAAVNPIAAYNLNETSGTTATDQSGANYTGTLINGPTWATGKYSGGLSFDGSNDYVRMGDVAAADGLTSVTVSAWVKFAVSGGGGSEMHFVTKSNCSGYPGSGPFELGVSVTQSHKAEFVLYPRNGSPQAYFFSGASTTSVDDGNWHFLTGRYDGNSLSIWVDGVQENSRTQPGLTLSNSQYSLELGGNCNGYAYPYRGTLDDVRIYDRAQTISEIQTDMNTPLGGTASPPPPPPPPPPSDTTPPSVSITSPASGSTVSGTITVQASASDNVGVVGVRFLVDGTQFGTEDTTAPYSRSWNAASVSNGNHTLTAIARDSAGNQTTSALVAVTVGNDAGAPTVPNGLRTTSVSTTSVGLAWNASSDDVGVTGYRVYRNGSSIGTTTSLSFTDTGLSPGTSYSYQVAAYDAAGNNSAQSSVLSVTTSSAPPSDTIPPSVPSGLRTTGVTTSQIALAWNASTDNVGVTGYRVYRNGNLVSSPTSTSFTDTGLNANTAYVYTVSARDAAGNASAQSSPLTATTAAAPPPPPPSGGTYSTSFDSNENPLSEGGRWRRANNAWTNVVSSGGMAYGTNGPANTYDDSYALLSGFGPNYSTEATVYRSPSINTSIAHEVELFLRGSDDAGNARGYECLFAFYGHVQIVRWNGPFGDFTELPLSGGTAWWPDFKTGDVVKCSVSGNTIRMYVNNTFIGQTVDSTFPTGQPGISFFTRPGGNSAHFTMTDYKVTEN